MKSLLKKSHAFTTFPSLIFSKLVQESYEFLALEKTSCPSPTWTITATPFFLLTMLFTRARQVIIIIITNIIKIIFIIFENFFCCFKIFL
jgi:hypothetical protein